jgi:outer membrane protein OmpA-like peptidoglycan-associated protein
MGLKVFSQQFRDEVLKLNLKTPPDVVLGIVELSGASLYSAYLDSLGKDAIIKNDKSSVIIKDPGNIVNDSKIIRQQNLNKNLNTPNEITEGITNLSASSNLTKQYLDGRGEPTKINDNIITNPGDVESEAKTPRQINLNKNLATPTDIQTYLTTYSLNDRGKETTIRDFSNLDPGNLEESINFNAKKQIEFLFNKNKRRNDVDPSENDPMFSFLSSGNYSYSSLMETVGKFTLIQDISVPNLSSVSIESNQPAEVTLNLALQQNRYVPVEINQFESQVLLLRENQSTKPYIDAYKSGVYQFNEPQKYEPLQFLNLRLNKTSPLPILLGVNTDPLSYLLNNDPPLKDETLLMNIAALELKFNFEARLRRAIERETIARTTLDEALTNPLTAINLLRDPRSWFEKNYEITVAANPVSRAIEFTSSLAGIQSPISLIRDIREDYTPRCFNNPSNIPTTGATGLSRFVNDLFGRETNRDVFYLNHTGAGQKYALFSAIKKNKYQPDYLADYQSGVFQLGDKIAQELRAISGFLGIGAGSRPEGNYYIGNRKGDDPVYLLQDSDGDQVRSNEILTETIRGNDEEPGYDNVSEYGSLTTNFIWRKISTGNTVNIDARIYSTSKSFRECSILFKTANLLDKGINNNTSPIDQTTSKFFDGYTFVSRGNATISPIKTPRINKAGEVIGYNYVVPGLDGAGKRTNQKDLYDKSELCRVWTKERPYSRITDLLRYKELNRKERNSVLDKYGNLNIHPSELNIRQVNNRGDFGTNLSEVEAFSGNRARKYMFSIENLAWRDSTSFDKLKNCEKGMNGGRVMWFPPYDIAFTDDTTANWSTHQFLGRSEPIYTYNNSERSGTLSWKIVVDHPSILNLLTQKELSNLNENEVDEILSAFWAGCVEFDVFELARIWNVFSQEDIDYFKTVISGLDLSKSNEILKSRAEQTQVNKQPENTNLADVNRAVPQSKINGHNLFFENDIPLNTKRFNSKKNIIYDTGFVESFDDYFDQYEKLAFGINTTNAETIKNEYRQNDTNPSFIKYDYTLGNQSDDLYFNKSNGSKWSGFKKQFDEIQEDLSSNKYVGFDLNITINSYTSPLAPDNDKTYNSNLAKRRFQSVVKWLITKVINQVGKIYTENNTEITQTNINEIIKENTENISILRENSVNNTNNRDKITFVLINNSDLTTEETIKAIYPSPEKVEGYNYFRVNAPDENNNKVTYYCFETDKIANEVIFGNLLPPNVNDDQIGSIEAKVDRNYRDIVCGVLSIVSSYSRRVTINIEPKNKAVDTNSSEPKEIVAIPNLSGNDKSITKREIAQRIINNLITECDYFELLKNDSPIVYKTIKEKLKYFQPAFHAITPEGLNSRLTFLQQCLRPGETIKRKDKDGNTITDSYDASNTAFGKPPICVLRIGDFYNTKIVINSLNISYDPLVFDLNPEGIGVQPMIANIQLGFKYIGGSGLRKYVDELQNALSFNYYANTDIYDDRTFANNDRLERSLINLEQSYFDNNLLDLIPIVNNAEKLIPEPFLNDIPTGTLGSIVKKRPPTTAGGIYNVNLLSAQPFSSGTVYQKFQIVFDNSKFYIRKSDDPQSIEENTLITPTSNKKYWDEITWRNYGELPFSYEFGSTITGLTTNNYYNWFDIQYYDFFNKIYETYGNIVVDNINYNKSKSEKEILLHLILNKNYNKILTSAPLVNNTIINVIDQINNINYPVSGLTIPTTNDGTTNNNYLFKTFNNEAIEHNYTPFSEFNKLSLYNQAFSSLSLSPIKLHLYPQKYLFKIGDGKTLVTPNGLFSDNNRLNPGNFTSGFVNNIKTDAEVADFYFKDYTTTQRNIDIILSEFENEMIAKIKLDLLHFWHFQPSNKIYNNYLKFFNTTHREIFTTHLVNKFNNYITSLKNPIENTVDNIIENTARLTTLIGGLSTVLDGYEITDNGTSSKNYEVIPNEYKLKSDIKKLFGYDPYSTYKTLSINEHKLITLKDVRDYIYDKENTNADKIKFLSLGNGCYFFKQISKDLIVKQTVSGSSFNFDNYLVESDSIKTNTVITGGTSNFVFGGTGITLNDKFDKSITAGITTTLTIQPSIILGEDTRDSYYEYYPMTYTFEKINYEFFDFTNKTLDMMLNDNFINKSFDLDISYIQDYNINKQIKNITGNTGQIVDITPLIYYGSSKEKYKNTEIGYYTLNLLSVSGETTFNNFVNINNFIPYQYTITKSLLDTVAITGIDVNEIINKTLKTTGLIDIIFFGFINEINQLDKTEILNKIKAVPLANSNDSGAKTREKLQEKNNREIENTLNSIFETIDKYKIEVSKLLKPINDGYNENYKKTIKSFNKILLNTESENELTSSAITNALIKGSIDDYTLTFKDTKSTTNQVQLNHKSFTSLKGLFNISSQNESPEIIGPKTEPETNLLDN